MDEFLEKGDVVILLDAMRHPTTITGVVLSPTGLQQYNVLLTNGLGKGKIKKVSFFNLQKKEQ